MSDGKIVHTELLAPYCRLEIREYEGYEPERFVMDFIFIDRETGERFGSAGNGVWYDTLTACLAEAHLEFMVRHKLPDDDSETS